MRAISIFILSAVAAAAQGDSFVSALEAFKRGDFETAERGFRQTATTEPRAGLFLALTLAATTRCPAAEPELEKAIASSEGDMAKLAGLALAQCRIVAGRFDDAVPVLARLRSKFPADADVLYQTARLQMRQWNETIRQLYREAPSSFRVNQISGEVLETQGRFAEAVAEYQKALEKNTKVVGLHYRLARALLMASHAPDALESAQKEFEAELALNPHDAVAHYQVAQILTLQGHGPAAAERLKTAISLDKAFGEPLIALGKIRMEQENYGDAILLFSRAVELTPSSETARYNLMTAYRRAGRMDDARREKAELDKLQKSPDGEFTEFLKKLGDTAPKK